MYNFEINKHCISWFLFFLKKSKISQKLSISQTEIFEAKPLSKNSKIEKFGLKKAKLAALLKTKTQYYGNTGIHVTTQQVTQVIFLDSWSHHQEWWWLQPSRNVEIKMFSIFGVTVVLYSIKILSGYRNISCNGSCIFLEYRIGYYVKDVTVWIRFLWQYLVPT